MGIYNNKDVRYLYIYCQKCQYKGQIIDILDDESDVICPVCGQPAEQVNASVSDSCQNEL